MKKKTRLSRFGSKGLDDMFEMTKEVDKDKGTKPPKKKPPEPVKK